MQTSFNPPRVASTNPFADINTLSFYDDAGSANSDPWSTPPSNDTNGANTEGNDANAGGLLDETSLPPIYSQAWKAVLSYAGSNAGSTFANYGYNASNNTSITFASLHKVLSSAAGLQPSETEKIVNIISQTASPAPGQASTSATPSKMSSRISRQEFYVALGLAAFAQQKQPISIEALSTRRADPPVPKLDLSSLQSVPNFPATSGFATSTSPESPLHTRQTKTSSGSSNDPWNTTNTSANGYASGSTLPRQPMFPPRSHETDGDPYSSFPAFPDDPESFSPSRVASTLSTNTATGYSSANVSQGLPSYQGCDSFHRSMDRISVYQQSELQGSFLTRHTVYLVSSDRSRKTVTRRYSDWLWLNEHICKKYPARLILQLPPKRVGISAHYINLGQTDEAFLDRRRRSLARYLNFAANHHILKNDKAVRVFLEEDMDLSVWRKMHADFVTPSGEQDETFSISLTPAQESSVPQNLEASLTKLREALPSMIESETRICGLLERISARRSANAADLLRVRMSMDSFGEIFQATSSNTQVALRPRELDEECIILNRDLGKLSEGLSSLSELQDGDSTNFEDGTLENLKTQREAWRSLASLLERYETRLKHDNIDKLKKRIEATQSKHSALQSNTNSSNRANAPEESRKLLDSIEKDQGSIARLLDRRAYLRYILAQEIRWAWRWNALLKVHLANWTSDGSAQSARVARVWESLEQSLAS